VTPLNLLITILAVGYLAYVIVNTSGLLGMFAWLRKLDKTGVTACMWCISAWLALAVVTVLHTGEPFTVVWLVEAFAAAGGAMMALAWTGAKHL
jgi:hypothetical protein